MPLPLTRFDLAVVKSSQWFRDGMVQEWNGLEVMSGKQMVLEWNGLGSGQKMEWFSNGMFKVTSGKWNGL